MPASMWYRPFRLKNISRVLPTSGCRSIPGSPRTVSYTAWKQLLCELSLHHRIRSCAPCWDLGSFCISWKRLRHPICRYFRNADIRLSKIPKNSYQKGLSWQGLPLFERLSVVLALSRFLSAWKTPCGPLINSRSLIDPVLFVFQWEQDAVGRQEGTAVWPSQCDHSESKGTMAYLMLQKVSRVVKRIPVIWSIFMKR